MHTTDYTDEQEGKIRLHKTSKITHSSGKILCTDETKIDLHHNNRKRKVYSKLAVFINDVINSAMFSVQNQPSATKLLRQHGANG